MVYPLTFTQSISIHAPRTGSDRSPVERKSFIFAFQSTLPARGATAFRAPEAPPARISIHAPRTGSDARKLQKTCEKSYFNPRSPHGERHCTSWGCYLQHNFNPRSPHGERRLCGPVRRRCKRYFNPRSPHGERHGIPAASADLM